MKPRAPSLFDDAPPKATCRCGRLAASGSDRCAFCRVGFPAPAPTPHFDGATYEPARDHARLSGLLEAVRACMSDGAWRTLGEIHSAIDGQGTEASISARLRDLRKPRWNSHTVERRRRSAGLYEYRVAGAGR